MPRVCACIRAIDRQRSGGRHLNVTDIVEGTGFTKKLNNRDSKNDHMNKAYLLALSTMVLLMATAFILPGIQTANAQYTGGGGEGTTSGSIEEQLKLAREKTSLAEQQGAYGSGTSMVSGTLDNTVLFIIGTRSNIWRGGELHSSQSLEGRERRLHRNLHGRVNRIGS